MVPLRLVAIALYVFLIPVVSSQNALVELAISNDKLVFQDRYYTSGLHITYRASIQDAFFVKKQEAEHLQLNVTLGNETYTPTDLSSFNTNDFDRPYAGWLFGAVQLARIKTQKALFITLESGITGRESLSGEIQTQFHEFLNIDNPTWVNEIAYSWLFNLKGRRVDEMARGDHVYFQNHLEFSVGSKDVYASNNAYLFFGALNTLQNSYRLQAVKATAKEYFGFIAAGYKYVALNALIQGAPFRSSDPFTTTLQRSVFNAKIGAALRTQRIAVKLECVFNTKETPEATSHAYGALTFGANL